MVKFWKQILGKPEATDATSQAVSAAVERTTRSSDNLHATLTELLDESNRLAFRPVYLSGPGPHQ